MNHLEPYQVVGAWVKHIICSLIELTGQTLNLNQKKTPDSNFFEKSPKCMFYLGPK